jgi:predicted dehydrogenase
LNVVRFGILGAARIAPAALVAPCSKQDRSEAVAIAARDPVRARRFAEKHAVKRAVESYAELVSLPEVDAVYIALPASHHHRWTLEALGAGKHVLCEKPAAASTGQIEEMVALAKRQGLVFCEAFHYRYHPLVERVIEICSSGSLGRIERLEGRFDAPIGNLEDIRYALELGGGATMDLGCYVIHWMRTITQAEPEVVSAAASERPSGVDEVMTSELRFPDGVSGQMNCSMSKSGGFAADLRVRGSRGELHVTNWVMPSFGHVLRWTDGEGEHSEKITGVGTTFDYQLEAFVASVLDGTELPTGGADAIANMRVIDAVYRAAGLPDRSGERP